MVDTENKDRVEHVRVLFDFQKFDECKYEYPFYFDSIEFDFDNSWNEGIVEIMLFEKGADGVGEDIHVCEEYD